MEISYRREMKHNYLVIEGELKENSYEARMLSNNTIEGLMKFRVKRVDAGCCYCYEITSKQPLGRLLESRSLKAEELRLLILGMAKTLNKLEEYLLNEEQILLEPDYIYVEPDRFSVEFCLIPGRSGDFPAELGRLLEYLLGKVDYQDKSCVVLAYGLYRESLKENYGMDDLLRLLRETGQEKERGETDDETENETEDEAGNEFAFRIPGRRIPQEPAAALAEAVPRNEPKLSWKERWKKWVKGLRGRKKKPEAKAKGRPTDAVTQLPWQMVFAKEEEEREASRQSGEAPRPAGREDMAAERTEPEGPGTTLLVDREKEKLRKLVSLEAGIKDITIAYYPFLIGKQENLVDYVLDQSTVSRLHLRIDEEEGEYRITDLNSTNGTEVAGRMLENNESAEVKPGDEVTVAGLHFRLV